MVTSQISIFEDMDYIQIVIEISFLRGCESNDLVFNIYGNNFIKATKNINKEYETKILDKKTKDDDKR